MLVYCRINAELALHDGLLSTSTAIRTMFQRFAD